jgi:hypothetical protein
MKMNVASALKLAALPLAGRLDDAPILFGSVAALTPGSGLYSYFYVVDNRRGQVAVNEVNILVDSVNANFKLTPKEHGDPSSWAFHVAVSGGSANPPLNEFGTFWQWFNENGVPAGTISAVFSFITDRAPTLGLNNNYYLYSSTLPPVPPLDGIVAYGHIVAPDFGVPFPPESHDLRAH